MPQSMIRILLFNYIMQSTCINSGVSFNLSLVCTSVDIVIKALLLRFAGFGFAPNPIPPNVYLVPGSKESLARVIYFFLHVAFH